MTQQQAAEIVATLAAVYDIPAWSKDRLKAFALSIADLDYSAAKSAAHAWVRNSRERPQPADIVAETRKQLEAAAEIPLDADIDRAWGYAMRMARWAKAQLHLPPFPPNFPAIQQTVNRMGWREFVYSENHDTLRAQFRDFYRAELTRRHELRHASPALRQPDDQQRLAGPVASPLPVREVLQLPSPDERAVVRDTLRSLLNRLTSSPQREHPEQPPPRIPADLREPTEAEQRSADERRRALREQLRVVEGGKAA